MTVSDKPEVLGRVSELARTIEGDSDPAVAMTDALLQLAAVHHASWAQVENALEYVAATAVNWLVAGDQEPPDPDVPIELWPAWDR